MHKENVTMSHKSSRTVKREPEVMDTARAAAPEDQVRERAYEIFRSRGGNGTSGDSVSDWFKRNENYASPSGVDWQTR